MTVLGASRDEGAIASEYAILASLIAVVIAAAVAAVGLATRGMFTAVLPAFGG